jgi:RNA polymerase sigma-70 factor, ECF subfamily
MILHAQPRVNELDKEARIGQSSPTLTPTLESSLLLLARAKAGDVAALEALLARYRPRLARWAHRRLPAWARDLTDTDDLVQDTLVKTVRNLDRFVVDGTSGLQSYLRLAIRNAIRDALDRARRRPVQVDLDPALPSDEPSPFERAAGRGRLARYEAALERLSPAEREAVVARFEFGFTHVELAAVLGKSTPDAARKLCLKATNRLLTFMRESPGASLDD